MWGNPFSHKADTIAKYRVDTVKDAIWEYDRWFRHQIMEDRITSQDLRKLYGKTLGCWCKPGPCHGDIMVMYIDIAMGVNRDKWKNLIG
jgi:hypothetical protein